MEKKDSKIWIIFREDKKGYLTHDEYILVCELHSKYKEHELILPCKCNPSVIQSYIDDLNAIFENGK